jgi:rhodanese-related sulfurtransferase
MNKIYFLFIGIIILILLLQNLQKNNEFTAKYELNSVDINNLSFNNFDYILDVREIYEFNEKKIKNTYHIPLSLLEDGKKINSFNSLKKIINDSNILIFCNTGKRARKATNIILQQGYDNVYYMNINFDELKKKFNSD